MALTWYKTFYDRITALDVAGVRAMLKEHPTAPTIYKRFVSFSPLELLLFEIGNESVKGGAKAVAVASLLLDAKADPNAAVHSTDWGRNGTTNTTLLRLATGGGIKTSDETRSSLVEALLAAKADANATGGGDAYTPLMESVQHERTNTIVIAKQLLDAKALPNTRREDNGCTALYIACERKADSTVLSLLIAAKADVNTGNTRPCPALVAHLIASKMDVNEINAQWTPSTPLLKCAVNSDFAAAKVLVAAGAIQSDSGALIAAIRKRSLPVVRLLLNAKGTPTDTCLWMAVAPLEAVVKWEADVSLFNAERVKRGEIGEHQYEAMERQRVHFAAKIREAVAVVKALRRAGVDPLPQDERSDGEIHAAVAEGNLWQTRLFLVGGLRVRDVAESLAACPQERRKAMMKLLVRHGHEGLPPDLASLGLGDFDAAEYLSDYLSRRGRQCEWCEESPARGEVKRCGRCRAVFYCSKECQTQDWKFGNHKKSCQPLTTSIPQPDNCAD